MRCHAYTRAMSEISQGFVTAFQLLGTANNELLSIVWLSLKVSGVAVIIASTLALPFGAWLALVRFPGRQSLIAILNGMMGLPPVVVGLLV